jgi:hypothetical protein
VHVSCYEKHIIPYPNSRYTSHYLQENKTMRTPLFLRLTVPLLVLAPPAILRGQFQQPTPEELSMTADPKAPGAAAVYLYREDVTSDYDHFHSIYDRIKVLTEKGKELATVRVPYEPSVDKVANIQGRTIHADGTIIPLTAKPSDLMDVKTTGYQVNTVVFTLPSVEVGSIFEYRLKVLRDPDWVFLPGWEIQRPYFVRKAHYSFAPGGGRNMMYAAYVGPDAKVVTDKKGVLTLDIADVSPQPDDDWMPPLNTAKWRVEFFANNREFATQKAFWDYTGDKWAEWVNSFTNPTGPIKNAVAQIVAPTDTDEQKAAKLYSAVQKLDNTDFSRKKSQAERKKQKLKDIAKAEDVWKQQSGSSDDITLLYAALARAAGLKVSPAYLVNRDHALFDPAYLSNSQFDDNIVSVELNGKSVFLDPGQKMCPFGALHWKHTLATGFRLSDKSATISTTPSLAYKDSIVNRTADLSFDETGDVKGTVHIVMTGPEALYWRQLALENDEEEVKKQFNEAIRSDLPEGVQADFDRFSGLDDPSVGLVGIVNVTGNLGSATGKHFFLPGLFFRSQAKHPFVAQDKRTISVDIHYPLFEQDDVIYHLPPGFNVDSSPSTSNVTWPGFAALKIISTINNGSVKVSRVYARGFTLLDPKLYTDLHDFYQKVAAADQQQLVLTRTPAQKGNGQ